MSSIHRAFVQNFVQTVCWFPPANMSFIHGRSFLMGSDRHYPEEAPAHVATVGDFWMDKYAVTNEQFARFVAETDYITVAERHLKAEDYPGAKPETLRPASLVFRKPSRHASSPNDCNCWTFVCGADWIHPEGPGSSLAGRMHHPVVHVAYEDAEAYAKWVGKELPTEAEWEYAARGGLHAATYAWGEEFAPDGRQMANTWQGEFPWENLSLDGYEGTSPVGQFPPNGYGLFDMIGNVWEWTSDWYVPRHDRRNPRSRAAVAEEARGEQNDGPAFSTTGIPRKVIKGGSFLCAPNYCRRYRPAARMAQPVDTSTCHIGFRLIVRHKRPTSRRCRESQLDPVRITIGHRELNETPGYRIANR